MNNSLRRRYAFFMVNYFVQGSIGIVYEPLDYILKDSLKLSAGAASGFIALMTAPLLFKPLYGYVSDFLPWHRYRRKPYLLTAVLAASIAFFVLASERHYHYARVLLPMMFSVFALAFADAVCGGMLVEDGKEQAQTGPYQALHIGMLYGSAVLVGMGGGWMTAHISFRWIFILAGGLSLLVIPAMGWIREEKMAPEKKLSPQALWTFMRTRAFWALCATVVLWNFYPFLGTVQFYYQSNVLHLSPQWIGSLMTLGSVAGIVGAAVFWKFCRRPELRSWMSWGPWAMSVVSLTYLGYRGPFSVSAVEILFGFFSVFFRLLLLEQIAESCPKDAEAACYALFLVLFDLAMYGSNALGGRFYDTFQKVFAASTQHDQWSAAMLIVIGAACTVMCRWTLTPRRSSS